MANKNLFHFSQENHHPHHSHQQVRGWSTSFSKIKDKILKIIE